MGHDQNRGDPVEFGVLVGDSHAVGIKVERVDRLIAQLDGCDSQDAGPGADIEHGLHRLGIAEGDELLETESGGRMLARAKA